MSKIAGYNGEIQVSYDGATTWHHLNYITSGDLSFTTNTEIESTWDDRGFINEVPSTIKGSMKIEGVYDSDDYGQQILEMASISKRKIRVLFWRNHRDEKKYYEFNAYVTSFNTPQEVEAKATFSAELSVEGASLKTFKG